MSKRHFLEFEQPIAELETKIRANAGLFTGALLDAEVKIEDGE